MDINLTVYPPLTESSVEDVIGVEGVSAVINSVVSLVTTSEGDVGCQSLS